MDADMKEWIAAIVGLTFTMTASARISAVSGDFDITPQRDYMQGLMCDDPMMFFKIFDLAAQGLNENSPEMKAHKKTLICRSPVVAACRYRHHPYGSLA